METNNADLQLGNLFDVKGKVALVTGGGKDINMDTQPHCVVDMLQALVLVSCASKLLLSTAPRST